MSDNIFKTIFLVGVVFVMTACVGFGGSSPSTRHYVLNSAVLLEVEPDKKARDVSVGLWLVSLPDILDRPQIVTRIDRRGIQLGEFDRWAGDLKLNMTQYLADELRSRLRTDRVIVYPWLTNQDIKYQIKVDVARFDGVLGGGAVLKGTWVLLNESGKNELLHESFLIKENTTDASYAAMVSTLSNLVASLSEQVSARIIGLN